MFPDVIVLDSSITFQIYDLISCDISSSKRIKRNKNENRKGKQKIKEIKIKSRKILVFKHTIIYRSIYETLEKPISLPLLLTLLLFLPYSKFPILLPFFSLSLSSPSLVFSFFFFFLSSSTPFLLVSFSFFSFFFCFCHSSFFCFSLYCFPHSFGHLVIFTSLVL